MEQNICITVEMQPHHSINGAKQQPEAFSLVVSNQLTIGQLRQEIRTSRGLSPEIPFTLTRNGELLADDALLSCWTEEPLQFCLVAQSALLQKGSLTIPVSCVNVSAKNVCKCLALKEELRILEASLAPGLVTALTLYCECLAVDAVEFKLEQVQEELANLIKRNPNPQPGSKAAMRIASGEEAIELWNAMEAKRTRIQTLLAAIQELEKKENLIVAIEAGEIQLQELKEERLRQFNIAMDCIDEPRDVFDVVELNDEIARLEKWPEPRKELFQVPLDAGLIALKKNAMCQEKEAMLQKKRDELAVLVSEELREKELGEIDDEIANLSARALHDYNLCLGSKDTEIDETILVEFLAVLRGRSRKTKKADGQILNGQHALDLLKDIEALKLKKSTLNGSPNTSNNTNDVASVEMGQTAIEVIPEINAPQISIAQPSKSVLAKRQLLEHFNFCFETEDNPETEFTDQTEAELRHHLDGLKKLVARSKSPSSALRERIARGNEALELWKTIKLVDAEEAKQRVREEELARKQAHIEKTLAQLDTEANECFATFYYADGGDKEFVKRVVDLDRNLASLRGDMDILLGKFAPEFEMRIVQALVRIEKQILDALAQRNLDPEKLRSGLASLLQLDLPKGIVQKSKNRVEFTVDLRLLHELVSKRIDVLSSVLQSAKSNNVVFPFGYTQAGKTTFIAYMSGVTLEKNAMGRFDAIDTPVHLRHLRIGKAVRSMTSVVSATHHNQIAFLDGPGFRDTGGVVIDIANIIALKKVFGELEQFTPLLFIDCHLVDLLAGQAFKDLVQGLVDLFNEGDGFNKLLDSFIPVITKIDGDFTEERLILCLKEYLKPDVISTNTREFNDIVRAIIAGLEAKRANNRRDPMYGRVFIFRPDRPEEIADYLDTIRRSEKFTKPGLHFNMALQEASRVALSETLGQLRLQVPLLMDKRDSETLCEYFKVLSLLTEHLPTFKSSFAACCQQLFDYGHRAVVDAKESMTEMFLPGRGFNPQAATKYLNAREVLQCLDSVRIVGDLPKVNELESAGALDNWLMHKCKSVSESIAKSTDFAATSDYCHVLDALQRALLPLKCQLEPLVHQAATLTESTVKCIRLELNDVLASVNEDLDPIMALSTTSSESTSEGGAQGKIESLYRCLFLLESAKEHVQKHVKFDISKVLADATVAVSDFCDGYGEEVRMAITNLSSDSIDAKTKAQKQFLECVNKHVGLMKFLGQSPSLGSRTQLSLAPYRQVIECGTSTCLNALQMFRETAGNASVNDNNVQLKIKVVYALMTLDALIKTATTADFTRTILHLENAAARILEDAKTVLFSNKPKYHDIPRIIQRLEECVWLDNYSFGGGRIAKMKEDMVLHVNQSLRFLSQKIKLLFGRDRYVEVETLLESFENLTSLECLNTNYLTELSTIDAYLKDEIKKILKEGLDAVKNACTGCEPSSAQQSNGPRSPRCWDRALFPFIEANSYLCKIKPLSSLCIRLCLGKEYDANSKCVVELLSRLVLKDLSYLQDDTEYNFSRYLSILEYLKPLNKTDYPELPPQVRMYDKALESVTLKLTQLCIQTDRHFNSGKTAELLPLMQILDRSIVLLSHVKETATYTEKYHNKLNSELKSICEKVRALWDGLDVYRFKTIRVLIDRLPEGPDRTEIFDFILNNLLTMQRNLTQSIESFNLADHNLSVSAKTHQKDFEAICRSIGEFKSAHDAFGTMTLPADEQGEPLTLEAHFFLKNEAKYVSDLDTMLSAEFRSILDSIDNVYVFPLTNREKIDLLHNLMTKGLDSKYREKLTETKKLKDELDTLMANCFGTMVMKLSHIDDSTIACAVNNYYKLLVDCKDGQEAKFRELMQQTLASTTAMVTQANTAGEARESCMRLKELKRTISHENLLALLDDEILKASGMLDDRTVRKVDNFAKLLEPDLEHLELNKIDQQLSAIENDPEMFSTMAALLKQRLQSFSDANDEIDDSNICTSLRRYALLSKTKDRFSHYLGVIEPQMLEKLTRRIRDHIALQSETANNNLRGEIPSDQIDIVSAMVMGLIEVKLVELELGLSMLDAEVFKTFLGYLDRLMVRLSSAFSNGVNGSDFPKIAGTLSLAQQYDPLIQALNVAAKKMSDPVFSSLTLALSLYDGYQSKRGEVEKWLRSLPGTIAGLWQGKDFNAISRLLAAVQSAHLERLEKLFPGVANEMAQLVEKAVSDEYEVLARDTCTCLSMNQFSDFRKHYDVLTKVAGIEAALGKQTIGEVKAMITERINEPVAVAKQSVDIAVHTECLAKLQSLSFNIPFFEMEIRVAQKDIINHYASEGPSGEENVYSLSLALRDMGTAESGAIVAYFKEFKAAQQEMFIKSTETQTMEWALNDPAGPRFVYYEVGQEKGAPSIWEWMKDRVDLYLRGPVALQQKNEWLRIDKLFDAGNHTGLFYDYYDQCMSKGLDSVVADCVALFRAKAHRGPFAGDTLIQALAYICAVWSRLKSGITAKSNGGGEQKKVYHLIPHPIQRLCLYRMLEPNPKSREFSNQLIEVLTGEGKSVVLGIVATYMALMGYDVYSICYSKYLSERDYLDFSPIFDAFGVTQFIHYSTISEMCENMVNRDGLVRDLAQKVISSPSTAIVTNSNSGSIATLPRKTALLMDEVDTMFSNQFIGKTYNPGTLLQDEAAYQILQYIYLYREAVTFAQVASFAGYQTLTGKYGHLKKLIDCEIHKMLNAVKAFDKFETPEEVPIVDNNHIVYKDYDSTSSKKIFGYKTAFQYFWKRETNEITSDEAVKENVGICVGCGRFSFAEIPFLFTVRMGVSGTVRSLTPEEKEIMQQYDFEKIALAPSIYGVNKLNKLNPHHPSQSGVTFCISKDEWSANILANIQAKQRVNAAVLVFFEDFSILEEFRLRYESVLQNMQVLEEREAFKDTIIARSTVHGTVTLCTRSFGRGADFICRDAITIAAGGVHSIQTFVAENEAEQIQLCGRAARQGQDGGHEYILLHPDLKKYYCSAEEEPINSGFDDFEHDCKLTLDQKLSKLKTARDAKYQNIVKLLEARMKEAKASHDYTRNFHRALVTYDGSQANFQAVIAMVYELNKSAVEMTAAKYHIYFCLDESGSMQGDPWVELMSATAAFVDRRCSSVLNNCGRDADDLVTIVAYATEGRVVSSSQLITSGSHRDIQPRLKGTNFAEGLLAVKREMMLSAATFDTYQPILIFMSDGGCRNGETEMKDIKTTFPATKVFVIGFGAGCNTKKMGKMTEAGEGEYFFGADGQELLTQFECISERISGSDMVL